MKTVSDGTNYSYVNGIDAQAAGAYRLDVWLPGNQSFIFNILVFLECHL